MSELVRLISPSGAIVRVTEEKAQRLGQGFRPVTDAPGIPEGEPGASWTVKQLKAYAAEAGIDLTGATTKDAILILVAGDQPGDQTGDDDPAAAGESE